MDEIRSDLTSCSPSKINLTQKQTFLNQTTTELSPDEQLPFNVCPKNIFVNILAHYSLALCVFGIVCVWHCVCLYYVDSLNHQKKIK